MSETSNPPSYAVPVAIVIAGLLIAGALFFRGSAPAGQADAFVNPKLDTIEGVRADDFVRGNPDASLAIIDFSDTECPFCKRFHTSMIELMADYESTGEVAWVYRHFPLVTLHAKAIHEAEATECAAELGGQTAFWAYIDRIYEITPANDGLDEAQLPVIATEVGLDRAAFESCLASGRHNAKVQADLAEAENAGGTGTPFPVIVSDKKIKADLTPYLEAELIEVSKDGKKVALRGALPTEILKEIVATILAN